MESNPVALTILHQKSLSAILLVFVFYEMIATGDHGLWCMLIIDIAKD